MKIGLANKPTKFETPYKQKLCRAGVQTGYETRFRIEGVGLFAPDVPAHLEPDLSAIRCNRWVGLILWVLFQDLCISS
jgi:hypothetical protein